MSRSTVSLVLNWVASEPELRCGLFDEPERRDEPGVAREGRTADRQLGREASPDSLGTYFIDSRPRFGNGDQNGRAGGQFTLHPGRREGNGEQADADQSGDPASSAGHGSDRSPTVRCPAKVAFDVDASTLMHF